MAKCIPYERPQLHDNPIKPHLEYLTHQKADTQQKAKTFLFNEIIYFKEKPYINFYQRHHTFDKIFIAKFKYVKSKPSNRGVQKWDFAEIFKA